MGKKFVNDNEEKLAKIIIMPLEDFLKGEDGMQIDKRRKINDRQGRTSTRKRNAGVENPEYKWYGNDEKKYFNDLTQEEQEYIAELEGAIGGMNKNDVPIRFRILMSHIDTKIKAIAIKKLSYLYEMDPSTGEYYKTSNWIDALCRIPIGRYRRLPISINSPVEDIRKFITNTKDKLDEVVYGHKDAKDQIIRFLAQRITKDNAIGNNVIGLEGPPGVGKTLLAKEGISKALDLPFQFISLSGTEDASHMVGHSFTYEGSTWGKIADMVMKSDCMNPVFFMDELDKVSSSSKGEEISNLLIHLTDSTQNDKFQDKYFLDVNFDLSKCLFVFSYNDASLISPILKDRMIKIRAKEYNMEDKVKIAQDYLLNSLCKEFNMQRSDIIISDDLIKYIAVNRIEEEKGVRNLKRALELILSNINLNMLLSEENMVFPIKITEAMVNEYVKPPTSSWQSKHYMYN